MSRLIGGQREVSRKYNPYWRAVWRLGHGQQMSLLASLELFIDEHLASPLTLARFEGRSFSFQGKDGVRSFQQPPVQNFLVENRQGKHLYWGLISMLNVTHDYVNNVTSGEYRLHTLYTPEQMRLAGAMTGLASELDYFGGESVTLEFR